ncbi:hypothetical protein AV530_017355 [Patagioenas fasciata monilis]|uniref:Uncharacterized protein n=1 Tax=Patagioenas fasciata monilis TaxID=372326 RepID=A0A1V4JFX2_PATFA|nr:hypothetical protein AV530_017355 [Patagioenas fasciata monilis]
MEWQVLVSTPEQISALILGYFCLAITSHDMKDPRSVERTSMGFCRPVKKKKVANTGPKIPLTAGKLVMHWQHPGFCSATETEAEIIEQSGRDGGVDYTALKKPHVTLGQKRVKCGTSLTSVTATLG